MNKSTRFACPKCRPSWSICRYCEKAWVDVEAALKERENQKAAQDKAKDTWLAWRLRKIVVGPLTEEEDTAFPPWDEWSEEEQQEALDDLAKIRKLLNEDLQ